MVGSGTDKTKTLYEGGPAIILVRSQLAVNIGMCARAMANFGLSDLRLVSPREGWPRIGEHRDTAYAAAAGASHLLDNAQVFDSIEAAVADLNFVWATTARERGQQKRIEVPAQAMAETAAAINLGEKHGIIFGPERTGLDNDDIALASAILTFPVNPAYGSLNLAQAVLLCGYEYFKSQQGGAIPFDASDRSPPAQRAMTLSFFEFLEEKLDEVGFFRPLTKKPIMTRNMRNMLHRMNLTQQDVRTLWGAVVRLVEGPRITPKTRRRIKQPKAAAETQAED